MSYALSRPSSAARGGLLTAVIGLHVGVLLLVLAAKTVVPRIVEIPLIVDFLQPALVDKPPEAKPLPVVKPQPVRQQRTPAPKTPAPIIDATQSDVPAPSPPAVVPTDTRPTQASSAGEPVSQARFDADYLRNPAPPYPPLSRRMGEEGKVLLRVSVTPQGTADSVEIRTSSGSPRLDDAARKTVRDWKFIPARRGDTPFQSWVLVPIIFKLEQ